MHNPISSSTLARRSDWEQTTRRRAADIKSINMLHSISTPQLSDQLRDAPERPVGWLRRYFPAARRFIVIAAIAWWLGGFTFYSGVAIPMGVQVLGTHRAVGFITEHVTNWLNVGGVIALGILFWNLSLVGPGRGKILRRTLLITWLAMAAIEIELIAIHPVMDRLIGFVVPLPGASPVRTIFNEDRFTLLHHVYLISTTVQWLFGVVHVWCVSLAWSSTSGMQPAVVD